MIMGDVAVGASRQETGRRANTLKSLKNMRVVFRRLEVKIKRFIILGT